MDASIQPAVLVVGMHRSGTSVVTRVLNLLGLWLARADDLLAAKDANPTGYWESASLVALNDRLLGLLGGSAWQTPDDAHTRLANGEAANLLPEARHLLHQLHPRAPWAWKDPRTCLTLPFWRACLANCGDVAIVYVFREPMAVARSLQRRDAVSVRYALALWEHYNRQALLGIDGLPVCFVSYEALISDPAGYAGKLQQFLRAQGAGMPPREPQTAVQEVVTGGSPQPAQADGAGRTDASLPSSVQTVWQVLRPSADTAHFDAPGQSALGAPSHTPAQLRARYRRDLPARLVRKGAEGLGRATRSPTSTAIAALAGTGYRQ
jgi:hypothetical protein